MAPKYNLLFVPYLENRKKISPLRYKICKTVHSTQALQYPVHMSLISGGFQVKNYLLAGEPAIQILQLAEKEQCDLIAMSTHGHRFFKDIILGSVADNLRHRTDIPILMIRASQ